MPLSPLFTASSVFGQAGQIYFQDTSTGDDTAVKSRVLYLRKYDGTYLTPSGEATTQTVQDDVPAECLINSLTLRATGDVLDVYVTDPVLGVISIGNYTQTDADTTLAILIANLISAINTTGTTGYTLDSESSSSFNIVAKAGLGATINGLEGGVTYPGGGVSANFAGGVSEIILPLSGQAYIFWDYADDTLLLDILTQDTALYIRCDWLGATNNVLYTSALLTVFNMNASIQDDFLIAGQQANPSLIRATNYYNYRMQLRLAINDAINSITAMSDITNSQQACDRGTYLIENPNLFY